MIVGIFYIGASFAVAVVLTFVYAMFRSVKSRDEWKSWRALAAFWILTFTGPYIYAEVLTKVKGSDMKSAVLDALDEVGIEGKLAYYKVVSSSATRAKVVAVAEEMESWGGTQHSVVSVTLVMDKKGHWKPDGFKIVNSDKHNKDGFTFPPYF